MMYSNKTQSCYFDIFEVKLSLHDSYDWSTESLHKNIFVWDLDTEDVFVYVYTARPKWSKQYRNQTKMLERALNTLTWLKILLNINIRWRRDPEIIVLESIVNTHFRSVTHPFIHAHAYPAGPRHQPKYLQLSVQSATLICESGVVSCFLRGVVGGWNLGLVHIVWSERQSRH